MDQIRVASESPRGFGVKAQSRTGRLLEFPVGRKVRRPARIPAALRQAPEFAAATLRERFLRAIEMERRGFVDGAISSLRTLHRTVDAEADPCLAINTHYFLGSFLMLRGETEEARKLAEEGIILAWEYGAREELELLENLSRQLGD